MFLFVNCTNVYSNSLICLAGCVERNISLPPSAVLILNGIRIKSRP